MIWKLPSRRAVLSTVCLAPWALPSRAHEAPQGKVVLTILGHVSKTNAPGRADFDMAMLAAMPQRRLVTRTPWHKGLQTFTEFLDARLAPAIATCESTQHRQTDLAERAARLTSLLRARVEVSLQEQNRQLLESMDRRAHLQLRLQETVEGLSVIAIGYYGVGLIGYALKGLEAGGLPIDASLAMGIAVPLVVGFAWLGLRRVKKRLTGSA